jgi:hypothetical protein
MLATYEMVVINELKPVSEGVTLDAARMRFKYCESMWKGLSLNVILMEGDRKDVYLPVNFAKVELLVVEG